MDRARKPLPQSPFGAMVPAMRRAVLWVLGSVAVAGLLFSCGARTPLLAPDEEVAEAGVDATKKDAKDVAAEDVVPPIDVTKKDADKSDCPDADSTFIYVVTDTNELLSFYPPTATFKPVGILNCPATKNATPFSMAVDRKGAAYVVYSDGNLFKVSTKDASCKATAFVPNQGDFSQFGMGFATIGVGPAEELYVASTANSLLGKIDVSGSFKLTTVAAFNPAIDRAELTGTGDGRLYAFFAPGQNDSAVAEVDKTSGKIIGEDVLLGTSQGNAWAFAFWGGYFYLFTDPSNQQVVRWDPATKQAQVVGGYSAPIVGAGVSTCAPQ